MIVYMQPTLSLLDDKGEFPTITEDMVVEDKQTESGIYYSTVKY